MKALERKAEKLRKSVRTASSAAIAFSGGVDSTLVAKIARDELGPKAVAVTIDSPLYPSSELREAKAIARTIGIEHIVIRTDPLRDSKFVSNPVERCYLCKLEDMEQIRKLADRRHLKEVMDGTNADDGCDYRPGMKARDELGVRSPLAEAGLTKLEVRELSKALRLRTAKKSSSPCLASRIPYGETITAEKLAMIEEAEEFLSMKGFDGVRVRLHGLMARIEVQPKDVARLASPGTRTSITRRFRALGFTYVSLDLEGYRTGSMDEVLKL